MANEIWHEEEVKFLKAIEDVKIPDGKLNDVSFIIPKSKEDFEQIPASGGCYWIWTNEPVIHSLHKNITPTPFDDGEIIYNGIAKDNVRGRALHHLLGDVDAGWSGISLDLYFGDTKSHRKKAFSNSGKVPYIQEDYIRKKGSVKYGFKKGDVVKKYIALKSKTDLLKIHLHDTEKKELEKFEEKDFFFRNGIDLTDEKHSNYEFRVYFITGLSSLYLDFIEKKWREKYGLPKLCSYSSGR